MNDSSIPADVSRRITLRKLGGGLAAAGGGAVVAFGMSGTSQASTEVTTLDIPPADHEGEDGTVESLTITVSGNYQYTVEEATTVLVTLSVASEPDAGDWGIIDQSEENALSASGSGPYSLSGDILEHDQLDATAFNADPDETVTREVPVRVVVDVMNGSDTAVSATAESIAEIEVTSTAVAVSAEVTGSGDVEIAV